MLFKDYAALDSKKKYLIQLGTLSLSASADCSGLLMDRLKNYYTI